ncbi:hypothetical protein ILUMI_04659 [Ignelater luminosus]|uniref:DUF5641 domain-containing protein n=1 Tax=Ignelater luminosus TaxID=2038154 RepID=A0A8K0D8R5_IGNLU|nr:hypothetical protein ILUMI_04659 [Ignelater luminosus]
MIKGLEEISKEMSLKISLNRTKTMCLEDPHVIINKTQIQNVKERKTTHKEREIAEQTRLLPNEDSVDSQVVDEEEVPDADPILNSLLSLQIEPKGNQDADMDTALSDKNSYTSMRQDPLPGPSTKVRQFSTKEPDNNGLNFYTLKQAALTSQQCAVKRATPKEFPIFDVLPECGPQTISTLRMSFGKPEQILEAHLCAIRKLPFLKQDKLETIVEFALSVKNFYVALESAKMSDDLVKETSEVNVHHQSYQQSDVQEIRSRMMPIILKNNNKGIETLAFLAVKSRLGWSVFALLPSSTQRHIYNYHICECSITGTSNEKLHEEVKEYYAVENLGIKSSQTIAAKELKRTLHIMETTLSYEEDYYKIGLLWKYDNMEIPDSRSMAIQRLNCLENRIQRNPELSEKINQQLEDFVIKVYIRKLTTEELFQHHDKIWYLPIFPVFIPNKPEKFRFVWDAAGKTQGISLNSTILLKSNDELSSLLGVLSRFREKKVGFAADIKEMFLRVGIKDEDQHAQRFYWLNGNLENPVDTYVMQVMTFGATCFRSCAQYIKNVNALKFKQQHPRVVKSIIRNHYVDDLLDTADTVSEAIEIAKNVKMIHSEAKFEISNWRSNSVELVKEMNSSSDFPTEMNMKLGEDATEKVLECGGTQDTRGVVAYLKMKKEQVIECALIGAKTRVAPIKLQTIPRLELDRVVLGAEFTSMILKHYLKTGGMCQQNLTLQTKSPNACLTTRAVHLEVAHKLDRDSFIMCLQNFINRREKSRHICCDRGTNFVAGERVLGKELRKIDPKLIANYFVSPEISFHFNPPLSPHMGGSWERLVKSVKIALYGALVGKTPTNTLLQSCLAAAEIFNNQLPEDVKVLSLNYLPRERFANHCWCRFVSEYIPEILLRPKWFQQVQPLKEGNIFVICNKNLPRFNWPKGKIIEAIKSPEGQVRKAKVQTDSGILERPVIKLALLSVDSKGGTAPALKSPKEVQYKVKLDSGPRGWQSLKTPMRVNSDNRLVKVLRWKADPEKSPGSGDRVEFGNGSIREDC